jgi:Outer membrane protein beta-barrel domain
MKTLLLASALLASTIAGPASAADMPVKAPPPVPFWSWTGFYIGGHGGYGWKDNNFAEVIQTNPLLTLGGIKSQGAVYGIQAGYNWQSGWVVGGLEIDVSATTIKGTSDSVVRNFAGGLQITDSEADNVKLLGTARARLGAAVTSGCCWNVLVYGTGGLAWEQLQRTDTEIVATPAVIQTAVTTARRDHFGWVAGVGGELQLGNTNWIARAEYLYYYFGEVEPVTTVTTAPVGTSFADTQGHQRISVVRGALSYKFGP